MDSQFNLADTKNIDSIKRICNGVLSEIAPEELILSDQVVDVYLTNPFESAENSDVDVNDYTDTPLGFGSSGELYAAILVPIIISALSKIITAFSEENLKQAISFIQGGKEKKDLKVELTVNEIKQEIIIKVSSKKLTRKKSKIIADKILRSIARELSK